MNSTANRTEAESLLQRICRADSVRRLDTMLREQAGVGLVLVRPGRDQKVEVLAAGEGFNLPDFCRMILGVEGGRTRCSTCRSMLAFAAWNRGLVQHACHGGVSVFAAPVASDNRRHPEFLVVSSCAFAPQDAAGGWREARKHARGLPMDMRRLQAAYGRLPRLSAEKEQFVKSVIGIAASVIGEHLAADSRAGAKQPEPGHSIMETALARSLHHPFHGLHRQTGSALIEVVKSVLRSNPAPPYTVQEIARAARLTPNHFSTVFHRHAGTSFKRFLTSMRIERAQEELRDLKLTIAEAAGRAGFTDANYFARAFKARTGVTPREWRSKRTSSRPPARAQTGQKMRMNNP